MKHALMQSVVIQSDTLNLGLPVGKTAYVVLVDFRPFNGLPYFIRVPADKKEFWVPECDLVASDEYIAQESEKVLRESLIDFALRTGNKALFHEQIGGHRHEAQRD